MPTTTWSNTREFLTWWMQRSGAESPTALREALSDRGLELSRQAVEAWARGISRVSPEHGQLVADVLGIPSDQRALLYELPLAVRPKPRRTARPSAAA